jgi:hypothetical protein
MNLHGIALFYPGRLIENGNPHKGGIPVVAIIVEYVQKTGQINDYMFYKALENSSRDNRDFMHALGGLGHI